MCTAVNIKEIMVITIIISFSGKYNEVIYQKNFITNTEKKNYS
jgi:hypothetical protein